MMGHLVSFGLSAMERELVFPVVPFIAAAHGTGVRLVVTVPSLVVISVPRGSELLSTKLTPIRFRLIVFPHVNLE
jgi:hypothetical protein